MTPVRLEPAALRSRVKHSTTEPLRSLCEDNVKVKTQNIYEAMDIPVLLMGWGEPVVMIVALLIAYDALRMNN